jgi:hypothetical protein
VIEAQIERHLVDVVRAKGGFAFKWVSPANAGVPDRIVFLPGGRVVFVELKAPGRQPSPLQTRIFRMLRSVGAEVRVIDSMRGVDELVG